MAGPVETISFVARRLIQFERRFAMADSSRKRAASSLFSQVSQSIHSLMNALERDQLPHEACRDLMFYSTKLKELAGEELGNAETERLTQALGEASDKEKLYLEFRASERKQHLAEELEKASILIRALANGIFADSAGNGPSPA